MDLQSGTGLRLIVTTLGSQIIPFRELICAVLLVISDASSLGSSACRLLRSEALKPILERLCRACNRPSEANC